MPTPTTLRNFLVGFVFLGSLVIVGWMTMALNALPWGGARVISVRFPKVNNLRRGDDVLFKGLRIGQVSAIRYEPDPGGRGNDIIVKCTLEDPVPLTDETEFVVQSSSALGGHVLEITPGEGGNPVGPDYTRFIGRAGTDFQESLSQIADDLRDGDGLLPRLLRDETIAEKFETILTNVERTTADLQEGQGLLSRLIRDQQMSEDFDQIISTVREAADDMKKGEGLLMRLIRDKELADRFSSLLESVSTSIEDEEGVVGLLLHNEEAKEDVANTLRQVEEIVDDVNAGRGVLGQVVSDEQLGELVQETVEDAHDVLHKVNTGDGTLGQVVNNRKAWLELVRILVLAREAIEDLREQAPISTFANILFATF